MLQVGGGWLTILGMMVSTFPAYYLILEEYYLGQLVLPMFSGPDDLSVLYYWICLYTAYHSESNFWTAKYNFFGFGETQLNHCLMYFISFFNLIAVISGVSSNLWHGRHTEHFQKRMRNASLHLHASYAILLSMIFIGYEFCPGTEGAELYPRLAMLAFGAQFLQGQLRMLLAGVTNDNFKPFRRTNVLSWVLLALNAASGAL